MRAEETHGGVAPVVAQAQALEVGLRGEGLHGKQLHRRDPESTQVFDTGRVSEARVGAP